MKIGNSLTRKIGNSSMAHSTVYLMAAYDPGLREVFPMKLIINVMVGYVPNVNVECAINVCEIIGHWNLGSPEVQVMHDDRFHQIFGIGPGTRVDSPWSSRGRETITNMSRL